MTTTLFTLETKALRAVRDPNGNTFTTPEIDDIINAGIDAIADFFPKEVIDSSITIVGGVSTYALPSTITNVYRVDIYNNVGTYIGAVPRSVGRGANSGWETQAGILRLPPSYNYGAGNVLTLSGYGPWSQLATPNAVSDLPATAIEALMAYVQREVYDRMQLDRVLYQQWAAMPSNSDVSLIQLFRIQSNWQNRWNQERTRLRSMRKKN